ncbi:MAG: DedA family protein [Gammaproteobacteria bacterium]|nr:DedA family protein [Gammaproteobacteria bacterium]
MEQEISGLAHAFVAHAHALAPFVERYGYVGIFAAVLVEGFGIPAPGQTLLAVAALLAARGDMDIVAVVAVAWCATVLGNLIGYLIGRRAGRRVLLRIGVRPTRIRRVEGFVRRYGPLIIVLARFVDGLRQFSSIVAGSLKMPWHAYLGSLLLGATLWAGGIGVGAYFLGKDFHVIAGAFVRLAPYAWIGVAAGVLALIVYLVARRSVR